MRRRRNVFFTVYTPSGKGSYRSHSKVDAAAHWVAEETGEPVSVVNESTGQSWKITAGDVSDPS